MYSERPGEASLYFHWALSSLCERSSPMRFFFSLEFRRNETQWKAMITVNQVSGGGGGLHPLPPDLCFFVLFCFFPTRKMNQKIFQRGHMLVDNMKYLILARCAIFPRLFRLWSKNWIKVWTSTPHQKFLDPSFAFDNDSKTTCGQPVRFKKRHAWSSLDLLRFWLLAADNL